MILQTRRLLNLAKRSVLMTILLVGAPTSFAQPSALSPNQSKLKELDSQINQLKQTLSSAHDKRGSLDKELSGTEKQISQGVHQLGLIQQGLNARQQKISKLQQQGNELNKQLRAQQLLLSEQLRLRYKMGEYQPVKWLLNQDDPHAVSRLLSYHQYFLQARQRIITQIESTNQMLSSNQKVLKEELQSQLQLQNQLNKQQQKLEQAKLHHQAVLHTLNDEIQLNKQNLAEVERNKANLARLIQTLAAQSAIQNKQPFQKMRKKLPRPVHSNSQNLQKMNQGLTFFAGEGTAVNAIYHGKVVFSDWLRGYGLLVILDHGQGYMTLYANNQTLYKQKGQTVLQGEQIAAVGHSGSLKQNGLYFEVRYRGKAVPPLDWLS